MPVPVEMDRAQLVPVPFSDPQAKKVSTHLLILKTITPPLVESAKGCSKSIHCITGTFEQRLIKVEQVYRHRHMREEAMLKKSRWQGSTLAKLDGFFFEAFVQSRG